MEDSTQATGEPQGEAPFMPVRPVVGEGLSFLAQGVAILAGQTGMSGASYEYIVVPAARVQSIFEGGEDGMLYDFLADIKFHDGPLGADGPNGVCETAILSIVADRLLAFQGPGVNWENDEAYKCVLAAINWLNRGTLARHREAQHQAALEAQKAAHGQGEFSQQDGVVGP